LRIPFSRVFFSFSLRPRKPNRMIRTITCNLPSSIVRSLYALFVFPQVLSSNLRCFFGNKRSTLPLVSSRPLISLSRTYCRQFPIPSFFFCFRWKLVPFKPPFFTLYRWDPLFLTFQSLPFFPPGSIGGPLRGQGPPGRAIGPPVTKPTIKPNPRYSLRVCSGEFLPPFSLVFPRALPVPGTSGGTPLFSPPLFRLFFFWKTAVFRPVIPYFTTPPPVSTCLFQFLTHMYPSETECG